MDKVYIVYDPDEVESTNAYIVRLDELGNYLKDINVGSEIYEATLKYKITEEYKHLLEEVK